MLRSSLILCLSALTLSACSSSDKNDTNNDNGNNAAGGGGCGDQCVATQACNDEDLSQTLLQAVNLARSSSKMCGEVQYAATTTMAWHATLANVAKGHSEDMAQNNFLSHTGSDGSTSTQRISQSSYAWSLSGEALAKGQTTSAAVVIDWLNSPSHCKVLMNPDYTQLGASCLKAVSDGASNYWTLTAARPKGVE